MSNTRIELEPPYNNDWKSGYLIISPERRKTLILYNSHSDRSSTQYARYLMSVKIGRYLTKDETVDHIDGDKNNDSINNLQILSMAENNRKSNYRIDPEVELTCPVCGIKFIRTRSQLRGKFYRVEKGEVSCSRRCGVIFSHITKQRNLVN